MGVRGVTRDKAWIACFLLFVGGKVHAADIQSVLINVSRIIVPVTAVALMISFVAGCLDDYAGTDGNEKVWEYWHHGTTG